MDFEEMKQRRTVREGYIVLLRAEATLFLPIGYENIRDFYQRVADACMNWAIEIYGESLRKYFLSLSDVREKSKFRTKQYRFWMRVPWEEGELATVLCESERTEFDEKKVFRRISHTWNLTEQTILPIKQVLQLLDQRVDAKDFPFCPDGVYREADKIVIYQNQTEGELFREVRFPFQTV
jgi:hypothetical protein